MRSLRGERGSTSVLILGLSIAVLVGVGFAVDGTRKGLAYSQATSIAEEAARAGGQALRARALATGADADVDPQLAVVEAQRYLTVSGADGTAHWDGERLVVETTITRTTVFLGSVGIAEFTVHGSGTAAVVSRG
ncbi:Putative Flp pilus-assembly TadE/G-like [Amycolatopsis pretoriensis]|uniref:Putative Flp pilus-assembly TadE/G-like n=1 Tax=Amycolatopsis pretoriensis TaxID=218821 RepID=A0A1H5RJY2_9PSEU|nr:pilus assembly protein TadG-related protein [Amycolatopsis pretoriensis]SEF38404.1 Putative Flp pilus-assembly TadE/G-like [Amycolatopsis pretoriensis]